MQIRWKQATGTTMTAQIEKIDQDNSPTSVGSSKVISSAGSVIWDVIDTSIGETVDLINYAYRVTVTTATAIGHEVWRLELTYKVTDILKASLYRG